MGLAELRVGWPAHELAVKVTPAQRRVQGARQGERDDRRARAPTAARRPGQRGRAGGGRRGPARAAAERLVEAARRDDGAARRGGGDGDRADAGDRQAPLRPQGDRRRAAAAAAQSARELFDTLLLWKARVPLDDDGNATVEIPLNDSLTSFRIVAVASSGAGLFGTGRGVDPLDAGPDAAVRAAAAGARRRPLPRDVHRAQRRRSVRSTSR